MPHQKADKRADGAPPADESARELTRSQIEALEGMYGNRYLLEPRPNHKLPKTGHDRRGSAGPGPAGDGPGRAARRATSRRS